jgi:hypothetical protein
VKRAALTAAAVFLVGAVAACRPAPAGSIGTTTSDTGNTPVPGGARRDSLVTVAELLDGTEHVGKTVRVAGRCLGYRVPAVAQGTPPRSRSDWQLEDAGRAIYVVGALPAGCSGSQGSDARITVTGRVEQDTMPALGGSVGATRRYLVAR